MVWNSLSKEPKELNLMNNFKGKKVLIFGLGLNQGGLGSAKFFAKSGAKVRITDLRNKKVLQSSIDELKQFPDIEYSLDGHKNEDIDWADLIIKNAAIKPNNPFIDYAIKNGKPVKMDVDIFLESVKPSQIIGITGTKGKSTTSSLIYQILKAAKKDVILAGNIGISVLDTIPNVQDNTLVVLEISSFQLESFDKHQVSPKWAAITNITPDHLNYYQTIQEYIAAKRIIGKYQTNTDYLFIRKDDPLTSKSDFLKGFKGQVIYFSKNDLPENFKSVLKGEHNLENIAAALKIAETLGINKNAALQTLADFKGVPFRMELVKTWNGVKIINDTAATSPESAIKAIQTYPGCILICGGMNKGMDYKEFVKVLEESVKKVFFLKGDSTDVILSSLRAKRSNLPTQGPYDNFDELLADLKTVVEPGDIILLSPAATSFNLFQNEWDRGRKFNLAVQKVFN